MNLVCAFIVLLVIGQLINTASPAPCQQATNAATLTNKPERNDGSQNGGPEIKKRKKKGFLRPLIKEIWNMYFGPGRKLGR